MTVFILQNQHGQYLGKDGEWLPAGDTTALFRSPHHDVALNQLVEVNSKDHSLRGVVVACSLDSKGRPVLQEPAEAPAASTPSVVEPCVQSQDVEDQDDVQNEYIEDQQTEENTQPEPAG